MLHHSLTASQRFLSYLLSLFDIHTQSVQDTPEHESALLSPAITSSSFMSDSIVMVQRHSSKPTYKLWSVRNWVRDLAMMYQVTTHHPSDPSASDSEENEPMRLASPMKQVLLLQKHAHAIVDPISHLRPSDQFAQAAHVASSLQQLVRLATDTLRSHPTLALVALSAIVQEPLKTPSSELRRQVFYRYKWGRLVILEMATLLKTSSLDPTLIDMHRLETTCTNLAKLDPRWKFKDEYQGVVRMAQEQLLERTNPLS